jgi:hypothetical protein
MKVTWTAARERDSTSYATERPQADEGFSDTESYGAPGEIASGPAAPRPPLRSGPPSLRAGRPTWPDGQVVELPASWFVVALMIL